MKVTLAALNAAAPDAFADRLAHIFEHSRWVPASVAAARPFASVAALHAAMLRTVLDADEATRLALLRAHPVLARRASLTADSAAEQRSHGLDALADDEAAAFDAANEAYQARFGFPFIIAVRGQRDRAAI